MNPDFSNMSSSTIESIRKAGIGCRGGVKVRGGRLPPVKIHNVLSKKRVIAPKIPQKRGEVKKEKIDKSAFNELPFKEAKLGEQRGRGRGRGRGARVYIQTEGTLFGDGAGFRPKLDRKYPTFERASGCRSKSSAKMETKVKSEEIDVLLESFDYSDDESDEENDLKPVKYPLLKEKQEVKTEIKKEIKKEIKVEIKEEVNHDVKNFSIEEIKKSIKVEPADDYEKEIKAKPLVSEFFTRIESATFSLENELVTDLKNLKGDKGILLLLQFPSCFPLNKQCDDFKTSKDKKQASTSKENSNDENQDGENQARCNIREIPEGFIGKLQFLKSGRMRLVMGSIHLYLENGSARHVTANAFSISTKGKEGDITVLGKVERKMLFRPHFDGITS